MYRVNELADHLFSEWWQGDARVSDFDTDLVLGGRRFVPFDEDEDKTPAAPDAVPPAREGLPQSYRMRAEAHYVDELTSRSEAPAPQQRTVSEPAPSDATAERTQRVFDRLRADLTTIGSVAALLTEDASPLARRQHVALIQAEAWRAAWLVDAHAIVGGRHRREMRLRQLGPLLERIRQGFAAESRLSGIPVNLRTNDWSANVAVDETAVVAAISGGLFATMGLVGGREACAPVRVTVEALAGELRTIEIAQDDVEAPAVANLRFFDLDWADRPGGWLAAIGAATARAVARQHAGHAALLVGERGGTVVRLNLTQAH